MLFVKILFRHLFLVPVLFLSPQAFSGSSSSTEISSPEEITKKNIESYLKALVCLSADFVQRTSDGFVYTGHIYLHKTKENQNIRIDYEAGLKQRIYVKNNALIVLDLETNKPSVYSLNQTPFYSFLTSKIDLSKEDCSVDNSEKEYAYLNLKKAGIGGESKVSLIFSKYQNGNLKNLEGWIITDANGFLTVFNLLPEGRSINDLSKIPNGAFD